MKEGMKVHESTKKGSKLTDSPNKVLSLILIQAYGMYFLKHQFLARTSRNDLVPQQ